MRCEGKVMNTLEMNSLNLEDLSFYIFNGKEKPVKYQNEYDSVYKLWKELWIEDRKNSNVIDKLYSNEFTRQDNILCIFHRGHCVGMTFLRWFDFQNQTSFDDSSYDIWPKDILDVLTKNGSQVAAVTNLAISKDFRKKRFNTSWKDLLISLSCKRTLFSNATALSAMMRVKRGMGKVAKRCGGECLYSNFPYKIEDETVDLIAFYTNKPLKHIDSNIEYLTNYLWQNKISLENNDLNINQIQESPIKLKKSA